MRLYEHEAKKLFEAHGIPVPRQFGVIRTPAELRELEVAYPVMLKAAVLTGGRGKAGAIRRATSPEEARRLAQDLISMEVRGLGVEAVLAEQEVEHTGQCYVGVTMDPADFMPVVIVSPQGGVEIERVARETPEAIIRRAVPGNDARLPRGIAQELGDGLAAGLGGDATLASSLSEAIANAYSAFQDWDARLVEINPLLVTPLGPVAADAKVVLDDNALWRQTALLARLGVVGRRHDVAEPTANERRAQAAGFPYVDLLAEGAVREEGKLYVGLVPGGAGYGIFAIDEVVNVGDRYFDGRVVPVNFMDSGGGPPVDRVAEMFHLLMDNEIVDLIITSRFGGISSCDVFIRGLVQALRDRHARGERMVPVHGRMVGTDLPNARDFMARARRDTPTSLSGMKIIVGNRRIMADVIRAGIAAAFAASGGQA